MGAFFGSADSNEVSVENGLSDRNSQCRRRGLVRIADSDNMTDGNTSVTVCQEDFATVKFTGRVILGVAIWVADLKIGHYTWVMRCGGEYY